MQRKKLPGRLITVALLSALLLQLMPGPSLASDFEYKILFYDESNGEGAVGDIISGNFRTLSYFGPGAFAPHWTHVTDKGFFYSNQTGVGALVDVGLQGSVQTLWGRSGFSPWTLITYHEGYLLFYQKSNGSAVIGKADNAGFENLVSFPAGAFGQWTHIISARNGLLFYNDETGVCAVGRFQYQNVSVPGGFGYDKLVGFKTLSYYPAGALGAGWTSIVETPNGILFYNRYTSAYTIGDIDANGQFSIRINVGPVPLLQVGYTSVVNAGRHLLFYNKANGAGFTGSIIRSNGFDQVATKTTYPAGSFKTGWSHLSVHFTHIIP